MAYTQLTNRLIQPPVEKTKHSQKQASIGWNWTHIVRISWDGSLCSPSRLTTLQQAPTCCKWLTIHVSVDGSVSLHALYVHTLRHRLENYHRYAPFILFNTLVSQLINCCKYLTDQLIIKLPDKCNKQSEIFPNLQMLTAGNNKWPKLKSAFQF